MGTNSGNKKNSAMTKRGRFNANPTECNHPSCSITAKSKFDKKAIEKAPRKIVIITSKAKPYFSCT